jgi:ABC-type thiamin/hydroxymethylpyrimidine transport system permease subunit
MSALYTRDYDFNNITGELTLGILKNSIKSIVRDEHSLDNIYFNSISKLDHSAATLLSILKLNTHLEFRSVSYLEDNTLNALVQFRGSLVIGLSTLSIKQCETIIKHNGALELPSLENINVEEISILTQYKGNVLELGYLNEFNEEMANALSNYKGEYLSLRVKNMNNSIASALSKYKGNLFLDEIKDLI